MGKKVVTIGGGTGSFVLLSGLRDFDFDLSAIVSMADDGGSTGRLRDELGVLPPGDVRQCLVALSEQPLVWRDLFNYRFEAGDLKGHAVGNLFLSGLEKMKGDFSEGLEVAMKALNVRGQVIPVTKSSVNLQLRLKNKNVISGEAEINNSNDIESVGLEKISLKPFARANSKAIDAILKADIVVIGPGNHYCSIIPNLLVSGISKALIETKARVVYIANLVNKKGHTEKFLLEDYINSINEFIGKDRLDYVIFNTQKPLPALKRKYEKRGEGVLQFKKPAKDEKRRYKIITSHLLGKEQEYSKADKIAHTRSLIRHDHKKLARVVEYIINLSDYKDVVKKVI